MPQDRRAIALGIVSSAVVALAVSPGIAGAVTKAGDVRVVNTEVEPVPIAAQGTTQVAGTVDIGNTPTVTLGGTPTVDVKNDSGDPLFVQEVGGSAVPAEVPFQQFVSATSGGLGEECDAVDVPAGKQLRIETVSFDAQRIDGSQDRPEVYLHILHARPNGGVSVRILGDELTQHSPTANSWSATFDGPLFALPQDSLGESVKVCAGSYSGMTGFVTGYLFD